MTLWPISIQKIQSAGQRCKPDSQFWMKTKEKLDLQIFCELVNVRTNLWIWRKTMHHYGPQITANYCQTIFKAGIQNGLISRAKRKLSKMLHVKKVFLVTKSDDCPQFLCARKNFLVPMVELKNKTCNHPWLYNQPMLGKRLELFHEFFRIARQVPLDRILSFFGHFFRRWFDEIF